MRHILLTALLASAATSIQAQEMIQCKANDPTELQRHFSQDPSAFEHAQQAKATLDARTTAFERGGGGAYVIPVVVHVIHDNGPEDIDDAQVVDALRILNEDFNRMNPDWDNVRPEFLSIVADVGIEFRLAGRDPEGNCTNGITRTHSVRTYDGDFDMTQLIQWPRQSYLNIWVAASASGAAGYTYYPSTLDGWPEADGIVVKHDYVGSIGTGTVYRSRVLSHEVGHWLNLMHCWGDSNEPGSEENCFIDDEVDDTPLTRGWTVCQASGSSCGSALDNVENYMEYSYCCKMFTMGQGDRMLAALTSTIAERENLWQPANLDQTGVNGPGELCLARFASDKQRVCTGGAVQFTDQSYSGVTEWNWSFPGGTPATSNEQSPLVTYSTTGLYPVALTVGNGVGDLDVVVDAYIHVLPDPGHPAPWSEGFENVAAIPNIDWDLDDLGADGGFAVTSAAAFTGNKSVRLHNDVDLFGQVDELLSPTVDLSDAGGAILRFRYAYARRNPADDDVLFVWVSADCGQTWVLRKVMRAINTLLTAGVVPGTFIPTQEQWFLAEIANIGPALCTPHFQVRFEFNSAGGNDLFIDDINLEALPVGIEEDDPGRSSLFVFQDVASGLYQVGLDLDRTERIGLEVLDVLGRPVGEPRALLLAPGTHALPLPMGAAPAGTYLLHSTAGDRSQITRFIVGQSSVGH